MDIAKAMAAGRTPTVIAMWASGFKMLPTAMESTSGPMETATKENGFNPSDMALELTSSAMVTSTSVTTLKDRLRAKAVTNGAMEVPTRAASFKAKSKVKAFGENCQMDRKLNQNNRILMKEITTMTLNTERVSSGGAPAATTKAAT